MSRRIEVELTSTREDGTWTWRAAGAKQPKGDLDGSLLYAGAAVGDVVRADADFLIDGIVIIGVLPPKGARKEPERIEIVGPPRRDEELVTTTLAPRGRGDRGDRGDRRGRDGDRRDRPGGDRPRSDRGDRPRSDGDRSRSDRPRSDRPRSDRPRPERPAPEPKPKPKRLRAGRTHRNAVLADLPAEQKPVAEQVLRGGIPAVRQAVEKQNETNRAEGKPEITEAPLVALAEQLMPALRTAEWRDKAEAALADVAELDLRDLRSVVVAADAAARDDETRQLAEQLRTALTGRVDAEQTAWLAEITQMLDESRAVRALRLSSRPPKAGAPFPAELASRLADAAGASMTADTGPDRFATVLDALAYSPVRAQVVAQGVPAEPSAELLTAVRKVASRLPRIAAQFGIEAPAAPARGAKGTSRSGGASRRGERPVPPPPPRPAAPPVAEAASPPALDAGEAPAGALSAGESGGAVVVTAPVEPSPVAEVSAPAEVPDAMVSDEAAASTPDATPAPEPLEPGVSAPDA